MKKKYLLIILSVLILCGIIIYFSNNKNQTNSTNLQVDKTVDLSHYWQQYQKSIMTARQWLDTLNVDPIELRNKGLKGKKKLVEILDAYYRLWQVADPQQKEIIANRIRELVAITYEDRYHDMLSINDLWFKQDATSYLRAALIMERVGIDTTRYREEIQRINQRLNDHMKIRGPNQRQIFHWYYKHFGLNEPFPLGNSLQRGLIKNKTDYTKLSKMDVYGLTHEIFAMYEYGDKLDIDPFPIEDKCYIRDSLEFLTDRSIKANDPDLTAELVSCIRYMRFINMPVYGKAIQFLLNSQNREGTWGRESDEGITSVDNINDIKLLHTTMVVIDALTIAFHKEWNKNIVPADLSKCN